MMTRRLATACGLAVLLGLVACGARQPVLYPNDKLNRVGAEAAQRDIDLCTQRAEQFASGGGQGAEVARDSAVGAGAGAAIGAAGGAVSGHAGRGAAVGAASGATAGFLGGLFRRRQPDPVYTNFVDRCLRERGYEPVGWE